MRCDFSTCAWNQSARSKLQFLYVSYKPNAPVNSNRFYSFFLLTHSFAISTKENQLKILPLPFELFNEGVYNEDKIKHFKFIRLTS